VDKDKAAQAEAKRSAAIMKKEFVEKLEIHGLIFVVSGIENHLIVDGRPTIERIGDSLKFSVNGFPIDSVTAKAIYELIESKKSQGRADAALKQLRLATTGRSRNAIERETISRTPLDQLHPGLAYMDGDGNLTNDATGNICVGTKDRLLNGYQEMRPIDRDARHFKPFTVPAGPASKTPPAISTQ
jgi:hypothetical protein